VTKQWAEKWPYIANVVFWIVKIIVNKVVFAASILGSASLFTRESTRIDNKNSEPKDQVRLHMFPEENLVFSKTHIVKSILSFSHCHRE